MREILLYFAFVNFPLYFGTMILYSYLFDLKHKMTISNILKYAVLISLLDAAFKYNMTQSMYGYITSIVAIILIKFIFNLKIRTSILIYLIGIAIDLITQATLILPFEYFTGINPSDISSSLYNSIMFTIPLFIFQVGLGFMLNKANIQTKFLRIYELFAGTIFEKDIKEKFKYLIQLFLTVFIILAFNFTVFCFRTVSDYIYSPLVFFFTIIIICILFSILCIYFINKIDEYKQYKDLYDSQEKNNMEK